MANIFPPRVGSVYAERYQLRESLGSGGVGQVFRAWDVQAQRLVALKAFNPAAVSPMTWTAYTRVVEAAAPVRHPDLVLPQGLPPTLSPGPFAVMESLVGEDLATMRARMGHVPWQRAVEIGARCAEILHAVLGVTGVGHRDLKASNVFVTEGGAVKLLDYGVAEFDVQSPDRTRVDSALGVVDYKAPEQLEANIGTFHADVFSLAVLVFEMIAGERPFAGASYFIVARKILLEPAPLLSEVAPAAGVPPALDALLQRALAKRPADRFGDLQAMQKALQDALRGSPRATRGPGRQTGATTPPPQSVRPAPRPVEDDPEADETSEHMTLLAPRAGARKSGIRTSPGQVSQVVPSGAKAVVMAPAGESLAEVNSVQRTVIGGAGSSPLAQRGAALRSVPPRPVSAPPTRPPSRAIVHPHEPAPDHGGHAHDGGAQPERTMILGDANAPPRGEATLMLPGDAPPESTMMLPDDGPRPESTMMLPDDGEPRVEGTMQISDGTTELPGEAPPARDGWPLQKILIVINVACGLLILIGLLVLVLGGGAEVPPGLEK